MTWWKWFVVGLCGLVSAGGPAVAGSSGRSEEPGARSISLLYIADLHAQLEPHTELFWHGDENEMTMAGGVSRVATAVEAVRRERPGRVLFLDAGDTIQGSAAAAWTEGRAVVPAVNAPEAGPGNSR